MKWTWSQSPEYIQVVTAEEMEATLLGKNKRLWAKSQQVWKRGRRSDMLSLPSTLGTGLVS